MPNYNVDYISDDEEYAIIHALTERDVNFNRESFLFYAQKIFVSIQRAFSRKDFKTLQSLETKELFMQHQDQISRLNEKGETNVEEMILVRNVEFLSLHERNGKDELSVLISCSMIDYLQKSRSGRLVSGDKKARVNRLYQMTLERNHNALTPKEDAPEKDVECPSCGTHMQIKYSRECKHCGTFLVGSDQDWIVSNLAPFSILKTEKKKPNVSKKERKK